MAGGFRAASKFQISDSKLASHAGIDAGASAKEDDDVVAPANHWGSEEPRVNFLNPRHREVSSLKCVQLVGDQLAARSEIRRRPRLPTAS